MTNSLKITLEEWFGDNDIPITEEKIKELGEAIGIAYEMDSIPVSYLESEKEENKKIKELENKINLLERYLASKGYDGISVYNNRIERMYMNPCGDMWASDYEVFG